MDSSGAQSRHRAIEHEFMSRAWAELGPENLVRSAGRSFAHCMTVERSAHHARRVGTCVARRAPSLQEECVSDFPLGLERRATPCGPTRLGGMGKWGTTGFRTTESSWIRQA